MSRLNCILILCFMLFFLNLEIYAAESVNYTQQWTNEFSNYRKPPPIVKVKDHLFFADMYDNTIHMWTLDGLVNNTCEFFISPNRTLLNYSKKPLALGNGKLVLQGVIGSKSEGKWTNWDLYVIADPCNCSSIKTLELDARSNNYAFDSTVPYQDTFDLFGPTKKGEKLPRRFNDLGEPVALEHHFEVNGSHFGVLVESIKPYDASEGYICKILYSEDNKPWLMRLDAKFQLVKETKMSIAEFIMSSTYGKIISLCHKYHDRETNKFTVTCDLFEPKDLNRTATVMLYRSENPYSEVDFRVINLPDGSAVVALSFELRGWSKDKGFATEYYLQRINADGSTEKPVYIDTHYNKMNVGSDIGILQLNEGEVCLIVKDSFSFGPSKERLVTKCLNMLN